MTDSEPIRRPWFTFRRALVLCAVVVAFVAAQRLRPDWFGSTLPTATEDVLWLPTVGHAGPDGDWTVDIHGCVYDPEASPGGSALVSLRETLAALPGETTATLDENRLLAFRLRSLAAVGSGNRELTLRFGLRRFALPVTDAEGQSRQRIRIPGELVGDGRVWRFDTVLGEEDPRRFRGAVHLLQETGLSVLSDVEDTLLVADSSDPAGRLRHAYLEPFTAVPGLAERFRQWEKSRGARFHFLYHRPWQVYSETAKFLESAGFPAGSFTLQPGGGGDRYSLDPEPEGFKRDAITSLLERFPRRRFVLIGDTSGADLEVYGALARRFPQQILTVWLRQVGPTAPTAERIAQAVGDGPTSRLEIFVDPTRLDLPR